MTRKEQDQRVVLHCKQITAFYVLKEDFQTSIKSILHRFLLGMVSLLIFLET
jgi:hypothetical protein